MAYQVFDTSVFNKTLAAEGRMLFVPKDVADEIGSTQTVPSGVLGVRLGVRIPEPEGLVDVFYASLQGRVYTFDADSFRRWRSRWQGEKSQESLFAQELVFGERTPVSNSPLRLETMEALANRGEAYVANGADWAFSHPLHTLGVVILVDGAVLIAALSRAARETVVIAAKYHMRRALGVPVDWLPPEDHD